MGRRVRSAGSVAGCAGGACYSMEEIGLRRDTGWGKLPLPKPLFGESFSGTRFEVALEIERTLFFGEGEVGNEMPGFVFCRMYGLPGVVGFQAGTEVFGKADVMLIGMGFALDEVNVIHGVLP